MRTIFEGTSDEDNELKFFKLSKFFIFLGKYLGNF